MKTIANSVGIAAIMLAAPLNASDRDGVKFRFGLTGTVAMPLSSKIESEERLIPIPMSVRIATPLSSIMERSPYGAGSAGIDASDFLGTGFALGIFGQWEFNKNHALRAKAEYLTFGKKDVSFHYIGFPCGPLEVKANSVNVIADYVYAIDSHDKGAYLFGGLGHFSTSYDLESQIKITIPPLGKLKANTSGSSVGINVGAGYNFNKNIGLELRYLNTFSAKSSGDFKIDSRPDYWNSESKQNTGFSAVTLSCVIKF